MRDRKSKKQFQQQVLCRNCGVALLGRVKNVRLRYDGDRILLHLAVVSEPVEIINFCGCLSPIYRHDLCIVACFNGTIKKNWLKPLGVTTIGRLTSVEQYENRVCAYFKSLKQQQTE